MLKLYPVLKSSRAAIDLASIMVGVIIIGLIGGVIAATVFAVIPWSQDKAAKQQLESIHTAENAMFGLSSDPSQALQGGVGRNTFAHSDGLAANNLLAVSPDSSYCVVATSDGKDYDAYVKSASGKVFTAKNSNKTPIQVQGTVEAPVQTCLGPVTGGVSTPAPIPTSPNVPVNPIDFKPTAITDGSSGTVLAIYDNKIWGWGDNRYSQIDGTSAKTAFSTPTVVTEGSFSQVSNNNWYGLALSTSGELYEWGRVDTWSYTPNEPTKIPGISNIVKIAVGAEHALALTADGSVYAWGKNSQGQVGVNPAFAGLSTVPQLIPGFTGVKDIQATGLRSMALKDDGTVWVWGRSVNNELGYTTTTPVKQPTNLTATNPQLGTVTHLVTKYITTFAINTEGKIFIWGTVPGGSQTYTPTEYAPFIGFKAAKIIPSHYTTLLIGQDGKAYATGTNSYGAYGNDIPSSTTPVQITIPGEEIVDIAMSTSTTDLSYFMTKSGNLYASGYQYQTHYLGDGTTVSGVVKKAVQIKLIP
jgi:alpha-tubulin suppressor-like RCC1 family protein